MEPEAGHEHAQTHLHTLPEGRGPGDLAKEFEALSPWTSAYKFEGVGYPVPPASTTADASARAAASARAPRRSYRLRQIDWDPTPTAANANAIGLGLRTIQVLFMWTKT